MNVHAKCRDLNSRTLHELVIDAIAAFADIHVQQQSMWEPQTCFSALLFNNFPEELYASFPFFVVVAAHA